MNRKVVIFIFTFFIFVSLSFSMNFSLFVGGGMSGNVSYSDLSYGYNWDAYNINVKEGGSIKMSTSSPTFFTGGVELEIMSGLGIYGSFGMVKQKVNANSVYSLDIPRLNISGEGFAEKTKGDVSLNLISVGVFKKFRASKRMSISVYGGITSASIKNSIESKLGYAAYLKSGDYVYFDYFIFNLYDNDSYSALGFNGGASLLYRVSYNFGVFASFSYYSIKEIDCSWKLKTGKYNGEFGNIVDNVKDNFLEQSDYKTSFKIKPSLYTVFLGIKIFF